MGHDHGHDAKGKGFAFAVGVTLNLAFVVVEVVYGIVAHSMALIADAGHNFGDVVGLAFSWGATILATSLPSARRTYGLRKTTILAALANAVILLFVTGGIAWESVHRLFDPTPISGLTVIIVAGIGVVINASSALLFMSEQKGDLNVRSAFLHLSADAALALGVAIAGGVIMWTGWLWLDPVVSIVLALVILRGTWSLVKESLNLVLDAVPEGIDPDAVRDYLSGLTGVSEVHDLHIWAMSTSHTALTAHLVVPRERVGPSLSEVCKVLHERFQIEHATIQLECVEATPCSLAPEETV